MIKVTLKKIENDPQFKWELNYEGRVIQRFARKSDAREAFKKQEFFPEVELVEEKEEKSDKK